MQRNHRNVWLADMLFGISEICRSSCCPIASYQIYLKNKGSIFTCFVATTCSASLLQLQPGNKLLSVSQLKARFTT